MTEFSFSNPNASLDLGGATMRYRRNLQAIEIVKRCEGEKRPATPEEQGILAHYVGWGDSNVLNNLLMRPDGLSADELASAKRSALNAHCTDLPVVAAMWDGIRHLGLAEDARILDPSAGIGHFKSAAPEAFRFAEWVEVELDDLTARILGLLHPESRIYAQGYQTAPLPKGYFDLAISNVPFGNYGVGSSFHKLPPFLKKSIHDFFFAYTVELLRPGGVMAFITTRWTMDKVSPVVRQWMAQRMDLLTAVRLPWTAFKTNAGTEVVTDILFLQKRLSSLSAADALPDWVFADHTAVLPRGSLSVKAKINRYWATHPENILGEQRPTGTMYRGFEYNVEPREGENLVQALRDALVSSLPANAAAPEALGAAPEEPPHPVSSGPVTIVTAAGRTEKDRLRLERLHAIYRLGKSILADEIAGRLEQAAETRKKLNDAYDAFVAEFGRINRPSMARLLKETVEGPFLLALERKGEAGEWMKSDIFYLASVREVSKTIDDPTPADALLLCLDTYGEVDMEYIAGVLGTTEDDAVRQLLGKVFLLPEGGWQTADEYLSGNILEKLNTAKAAAEFDSRFRANVEALKAAMPEPVPADDIRTPLGAPWVPAQYIEEFLAHLLTAPSGTTYHVSYAPRLSRWSVDVSGDYRIPSSRLRSRWGTPHLDAIELVTMGLNKKTPIVYDHDGDTRVVNVAATITAQAKLGEIQREFEQWLWSEPERTAKLVSLYNQTYNVWSVPSYDGSHLSFPGLSRSIELRPWQKNAVWRILRNKATLLWHDVGAGKTLAAIAAVMEAKRLKFARKAMVVVPNHLVSQWAAAALTAYPGANILVATRKQMSKASRSTFMSRIAMNEWDMVIVPFSSFGLLPVSQTTLERFVRAEINALEELLYELESEARNDKASARAIKAVEKAKQRFEAKLERLAESKKDDQRVVTWEELGIGMLVVDEAHAFKNLFFATKMNRVAGLPNSNSQRAFDMFIKTRTLLQSGGKLVFLTATPVTNTLAELYNMQRYLQYDDLESLGLTHFDAWASQFALVESSLELAPEGTGFRMVERFRKFVNLPELLRMWFQVADRVRLEDTGLVERPELRGPYKVLVDVPGMDDYMATLAERAERIRNGVVTPSEDNMLSVTSDGRKAAADLSMVRVPDEPTPRMPKIDALVDVIEKIYRASEPVLGAQLVFCDIGTPKKPK